MKALGIIVFALTIFTSVKCQGILNKGVFIHAEDTFTYVTVQSKQGFIHPLINEEIKSFSSLDSVELNDTLIAPFNIKNIDYHASTSEEGTRLRRNEKLLMDIEISKVLNTFSIAYNDSLLVLVSRLDFDSTTNFRILLIQERSLDYFEKRIIDCHYNQARQLVSTSDKSSKMSKKDWEKVTKKLVKISSTSSISLPFNDQLLVYCLCEGNRYCIGISGIKEFNLQNLKVLLKIKLE